MSRLSESYALDLPVTYVQATLLLDSITDFAANPSRRQGGLLFQSAGWRSYAPASILGRYIPDLNEAAKHLLTYASVNTILNSGWLPEEILRLGDDFLADVQAFSHNGANWYASAPKIPAVGDARPRPALTLTGRRNAQRLMDYYGLQGIAQTVGLTQAIAA